MFMRLFTRLVHHDCVAGDGTPIPSSDMTKVRDAIWRNTVFNKWRQGDIYVIDNAAARCAC